MACARLRRVRAFVVEHVAHTQEIAMPIPNVGEYFAQGNLIMQETECGPRAIGQIFVHIDSRDACNIADKERQHSEAAFLALAGCMHKDIIACIKSVYLARDQLHERGVRGIDTQRCRIMLERAGVELPRSNWT